MKSKERSLTKRIGGICLLLFVVCFPPGAACAMDAEAGSGSGAEFSSLINGSGLAVNLPIYHFGLELITEGTTNYTVERTMRNVFPFDLDFTVFVAWGYTGDKLSIKVADGGDTGDRIFGVALANSSGEITPSWGTLYSSDSQDEFEIIIPVFQPGVVVYFISGFFAPSEGEDAYTYTITLSFPQ